MLEFLLTTLLAVGLDSTARSPISPSRDTAARDTTVATSTKATDVGGSVRDMSEGRLSLELHGMLGKAGRVGASGGGAGFGLLWKFALFHVDFGYTVGQRDREIDPKFTIDSYGTCRYANPRAPQYPGVEAPAGVCAETERFDTDFTAVEGLFGLFDRAYVVAGAGYRWGYPTTPFASVGFVLPSSSGSTSAIVRLGLDLVSLQFGWSMTPQFGKAIRGLGPIGAAR